MRKKINWFCSFVFWSWGFLLPTNSAHAETRVCEKLSTSRDILNCAIVNHPDMRESEESLLQGKFLESVAKQRPNPELNSKVLFGDLSGQSFSYTEFDLAHTIELGGKRKARIQKAKSERERLSADALGIKEQVFIKTLLSLYRIREIQTELSAADEALSTFTRLKQQLASRPQLDPEQQVFLQVIEIATGDYRMRKTTLETELFQKVKEIERATGKEFEPNPSLLPPLKRQWPHFHEAELAQSIQSSSVRMAEAQLKEAHAEYSIEKSHSWPNIKVGPSAALQFEEGSYKSYGANLSLPLPIFQHNAGGRAYASRGITKAEVVRVSTQKEAEAQHEIFLQKYKAAVKALQVSLSQGEITQRHREIEELFNRGLVSGSLLIEVHRQVFDFTKSQNEQELAAIEALARLYALEGRLFEEKL